MAGREDGFPRPLNRSRSIYTTFVSAFLIATVNGMLLLLLPLLATDSGISVAGVGTLFALRGAGTLMVDIPAGLAIRRLGEKKLLLLGMAVMAVSCVGFALWQAWPGMVLFALLFGIGMGGWSLAQHSFVSVKTANGKRGRGASKLVALQRAGAFAGPVLGGGMGEYFGYETALLVGAVFTLTALVLCSVHMPSIPEQIKPKSLKELCRALPVFIKQHQRVFITFGGLMMVLRAVRGARQLLLPLWGNHIGLNAAEIGLIFGASAVTEVVLIYIGGYIADYWGRKWTLVPGLVLLSLSLLLMPLCQTFVAFLLLALVAGIANGLGGGMIMTLGADLAPKENRGAFLGAWRLLGDVSGVLSPVLIGWIGSVFILAGAAMVSGAVGVLGSAVVIFCVPETLAKFSKRGR